MTATMRWLAEHAAARTRAGLTRTLTPWESGPVDLAGNDYLGMATHPRVVQAAARTASEYGAGAGASRLVTGTLPIHEEAQTALAGFTGQPAALVMSTGYHANLSAVPALADADTLIVSDAHVHASLIDACRLARGTVRVVEHNDPDAVRAALADRAETRALVVVESVYSVLGDLAPLTDLLELCVAYDATVLVDEAHALGVVGDGGRGLTPTLPPTAPGRLVVTATLSKALGSQGGVVLADPEVIDHLVNTARAFIFDTGLAPPAAGAALAALDVVREQPSLPERARAHAAALADACGVDAPPAAVLSVPMESPAAAVHARDVLAAKGIRVGCFRPPSVPDGVSRLRLTARASLSDRDIELAHDMLTTILR